eukprot:274357-Chlamydomonas_euryale.AAC.10
MEPYGRYHEERPTHDKGRSCLPYVNQAIMTKGRPPTDGQRTELGGRTFDRQAKRYVLHEPSVHTCDEGG